jgi:hypothetical protein
MKRLILKVIFTLGIVMVIVAALTEPYRGWKTTRDYTNCVEDTYQATGGVTNHVELEAIWHVCRIATGVE